VRFVEQSREARAQMLQHLPKPVVDATLTVLGEPSAARQSITATPIRTHAEGG
jgi:hypothetical protein